MKKHILVISQYFYPEQFRINDICQEWVKQGYKVTVLTGIPNYPLGDYYEGYGLSKKRTETWEGVNIIRIPITPRKKGAIKLALNYLSFVVSGFFWSILTKVQADAIFIYEVSPMTQALPAIWYAKRRKCPCYLYVMDLWPENVEIVLGIKSKVFLNSIEMMVKYIYKRCDKIFTSSKSFIEKITDRGIDKSKIEFWPQYAEDFYVKYQGQIEEKDLEIPQDGVLNFTFAGNIGYAQGLKTLVDAATILKENSTLVRFNLIGDGRYLEQLKVEIKSEEVEKYFNFISKKPAVEIPKYFAQSDAALITLSKSEVFAMTIPAKTQSCLKCGMPIIVAADGEVQQIVQEAECGYFGDAENAKQLVENVFKFIETTKEQRQKFSENAVSYYENNYDKHMLLKRMNQYFDN